MFLFFSCPCMGRLCFDCGFAGYSVIHLPKCAGMTLYCYFCTPLGRECIAYLARQAIRWLHHALSDTLPSARTSNSFVSPSSFPSSLRLLEESRDEASQTACALRCQAYHEQSTLAHSVCPVRVLLVVFVSGRVMSGRMDGTREQ